ncbi:MAG: hypothetical protein D6698_17665 [Gammaproteobacteria bacterium]|nr:MAG: hypothetical protein D6698_17665 [Gammaproteobacteria bacterium]
MKKLYCAVAVSLACASGVASAIDLTDYTVPVSKYSDTFVDGKFNTKTGNQDKTSYDLNLNLNTENVNSTVYHTLRLKGDALVDAHQKASNTEKFQKDIVVNVQGNIDNYFKDDNRLFWFGSAEYGYQNSAVDDRIKAGVGIGYGRVFDATPLAKVLRIEEELREHGVIKGGTISDKTYIKLAEVIDREDEFKSKHGADEYKPYYFEAFEAILKEEGVLREGGLGATGSLFMNRVLYDEKVSTRRHGWVVRGGTNVVFSDFSGSANSDPSLDIEIEYAKPYGYKHQFDEVFQYSTVFSNDTDQNFSNRVSYTYEVSDMIDIENVWDLTYTLSGTPATTDVINNKLSSSFRYYLSNRISTGFTVSLSKITDDINNNTDEPDLATFFDIRYRLK